MGAGGGDKELNLDQLNKRVQQLKAAKLKAQSTKGLDAVDLFLMEGNPKAKEAYEKGDSKGLIAEIDNQIAHYEGKRNELTDTPKPEPEPEPTKIELPGSVTTTGQAVKYLMEDHKMTEEEAKKWLVENL